jgi:hypothetical protein
MSSLPDDPAKMTVKQLRNKLDDAGIKHTSMKNKADLVAAVGNLPAFTSLKERTTAKCSDRVPDSDGSDDRVPAKRRKPASNTPQPAVRPGGSIEFQLGLGSKRGSKRSKEEVADEVVEADVAEKKVSTTAASTRVWRTHAFTQLCFRCCGLPALPTISATSFSHTLLLFPHRSPFMSSHMFSTHLDQLINTVNCAIYLLRHTL